MRSLPFLLAGAVFLLQPPVKAAEPGGASDPAIGWLEVSIPGVSAARPAVRAAWDTLAELPLRLVDQQELFDYLQELDRRGGIEEEAGKLLRRGRELSLGLKLDRAADAFRGAAEKLEEGFARYHEPDRLAEPLLMLGVALFQAGKKDEARKAFMRAAALAPGMELAEGYYGPSVRAAFARAREELGRLEPAVPPPGELERISRAAELKGMVVISLERMGDRPVLRLALFDAARETFTAAETLIIPQGDARAAGAEVAERLRPALAAVAGVRLVPRPPAPDGGMAAADQQATERDPWYVRHWWIWPTAAVVVGAAIALPLTVFREDVVDIRVSY